MIKTKVISGLINPTGMDTIGMNDTAFLLPTASHEKCRTISRIKKKKKKKPLYQYIYLSFLIHKIYQISFHIFNNTVNFELLWIVSFITNDWNIWIIQLLLRKYHDNVKCSSIFYNFF